MRKGTGYLLILALLAVGSLGAQNTTAGSANGMTMNGATGLIVVPDARIGWERAKFGVDVGYGVVYTGNQQLVSLPRVSVSILQRAEVYSLFHFRSNDDNPSGFKNFVIGGKFQLFKDGGSALALGGDFEFANNQPSGVEDDESSKIYLSATYAGKFFDAPAVTTATIGWQLWNMGEFSSQFVYGMGFSMSLFPRAFKNHVFWITDFANFSSTVYAEPVDASYRGAFNTGVRIRPVKSGKFNLVIDVVGVDLLDEGERGLSATISGGMAF